MRLICHKCTNYFLLHNFFLLFFTLSIPYLPLIYPLSTPYLPLIYPPRWRKLAACVQFKIQNSKLFSTEPSAKESRRAGAAEYVTKDKSLCGSHYIQILLVGGMGGTTKDYIFFVNSKIFSYICGKF